MLERSVNPRCLTLLLALAGLTSTLPTTPPPARAQSEPALPTLPMVDHVGGYPWQVVVASPSIAYAPSGPRVSVLDISQPGQIQRLAESELADGEIAFLSLEGDHLYASSGDRLWVFGLANPLAPALIGQVDLFGGIEATEPGRLYLFDRYSLGIVDITRPAEPRLLASVPIDRLRRVDVIGPALLLVASASEGLIVLDVSDPTAPSQRAILPIEGVYDLAVHDDVAYAIGRSTEGTPPTEGPSTWMDLFDLSDPDDPVRLGERSLGFLSSAGSRRMVLVEGASPGLVVTLEGTQIATFSLDDPREPQAQGLLELPETRDLQRAAAIGNRLLLPSGGGIQEIDVSDLAAPRLTGRLASLTAAESLCSAGDLIVAAETGQLGLIDPSAGNRILSTLPLRGWIHSGRKGVDCTDTLVFVATLWNPNLSGATNDDSLLSVIDIADPLAPKVIASLRTGDRSLEAVAVDGDWLYTFEAGEPNSFGTWDVSDPSDPRRVAQVSIPATGFNWLLHWSRSGDRLLMATDETLSLVDVADPRSPRLVAQIDVAGSIAAIEASAGLGLIATADHQLRILDLRSGRWISQVGLPASVTGFRPSALHLQGGRLWIAGSSVEAVVTPTGDHYRFHPRLIAMDLREPGLPRLERVYAQALSSWDLADGAEAGSLVVGSGFGGLHALNPGLAPLPAPARFGFKAWLPSVELVRWPPIQPDTSHAAAQRAAWELP